MLKTVLPALLVGTALLALALPGHALTPVALRPGMPRVAGDVAPALWASVPDADEVAKDLTLTPAQPFTWVFAPGQPISLTVSSKLAAARLVLTVWNWDCVPVARQECPSPAAEQARFEVSGRGTYLLTVDRFVGDQCQARLARSFSVCPSNEGRRELWRQGAFWPGCCSFPGRQNWRNEYGPAHPAGLSEQATVALDAELSARLGLILVRPDLPAQWPAPDKPLALSRCDEACGAFTSRGFQLALQVSTPSMADWTLQPQYQKVTDPKWRYPCQEAPTRQFVREVVSRYAKDTAFVEAGNEPDNLDFWRGTVPELVATHHWVAEEAHHAAPGVPVLSSGLCLMDPVRTGQIIRGVRDAVEAVGYHSHGGVETLAAQLTAMVASHAAAGYEHPVFYNTEMGFANWRLDMERASAATAVQKLLYCWAHGNRAALLYCSRDIGGPRCHGDWGYLDYTMCPRFTYGAVSAFMDTYAGAVCEQRLTEANGLYVYVFRRGEQLIVPVFSSNDFPRPVTLSTNATAAALLDSMGNSSPLAIPQGKVTVTAGYCPSAVVLTGATEVNLGG